MPNSTLSQSNTPSESISELQNTIFNIDSLSQEGFKTICAIANLAMCRIESSVTSPLHMEDIYQALQAIKTKSDDIQDCITTEAESMGCNYRDDRYLKRHTNLTEVK